MLFIRVILGICQTALYSYVNYTKNFVPVKSDQALSYTKCLKDTQRAAKRSRNSEGTRTLLYSQGTQTLKILRRSDTQVTPTLGHFRTLRHPDTQTLGHSDTWTLRTLYSADLSLDRRHMNIHIFVRDHIFYDTFAFL